MVTTLSCGQGSRILSTLWFKTCIGENLNVASPKIPKPSPYGQTPSLFSTACIPANIWVKGEAWPPLIFPTTSHAPFFTTATSTTPRSCGVSTPHHTLGFGCRHSSQPWADIWENKSLLAKVFPAPFPKTFIPSPRAAATKQKRGAMSSGTSGMVSEKSEA